MGAFHGNYNLLAPGPWYHGGSCAATDANCLIFIYIEKQNFTCVALRLFVASPVSLFLKSIYSCAAISKHGISF